MLKTEGQTEIAKVNICVQRREELRQKLKKDKRKAETMRKGQRRSE